jgi:L-seryl-tRNA(Ser) seleniumtransferase
MKSAANKNSVAALRSLPSVDALVNTPTAQSFKEKFGAHRLKEAARAAIGELREELRRNQVNGKLSRLDLLEKAESRLRKEFNDAGLKKFQRVVNATGVVVHTNLGRAPLAEKARRAAAENAFGYCTLEYDLETGRRGRRGAKVERLLCELTEAEAAIIVNNCAAAALLVLSSLAAGGECVVSRGELVEIGGDFRVPDVMAQSGAKMVEVGTTNRTKLLDFERAVTENTRVLMRVHPSNFRIVGFTAMPDLRDLAGLARAKDLIFYEDAGSGALVDLSRFGLSDEPVISASVRAGADVVSFSGDKLLGACQAGIIVGREKIIERLRENPLYRALRADKIVYAALAETLEIYRREQHLDEIPVLRMLTQTREAIEKRAKDLIVKTEKSSAIHRFILELIEGNSAVGGGAAPLVQSPTVLISLRHDELSNEELERALRLNQPPIICRVADDRVLLDLRTVFESEADEIVSALERISAQKKT